MLKKTTKKHLKTWQYEKSVVHLPSTKLSIFLTMFLKENLKLLRKRRKRSQEDVAKSLNLTRSAYNSYENGVA